MTTNRCLRAGSETCSTDARSEWSELPPTSGRDKETTDAWGRTFDYSFDDSSIVTLRSLGADSRPGGDRDNRDMTGTFATRDARGNWQDELAEWKQNPSQR